MNNIGFMPTASSKSNGNFGTNGKDPSPAPAAQNKPFSNAQIVIFLLVIAILFLSATVLVQAAQHS